MVDKTVNEKCSPVLTCPLTKWLAYLSMARDAMQASGYRLNAAVLPDITQFTIALNFEFSVSTLSLVQPPFPRDPGPLEATGRRAYSPGARGESAPAAARYCYPSESSAGTRTR